MKGNVVNARPIRILLFGYINTNVIDGSAFFLTGLASMLTAAPEIEVDLLLATPVRRTVVLDEVLNRPTVNVIDPFADPSLSPKEFPFLSNGSMTQEEAAAIIDSYWSRGSYDLVFVRSTEVGAQLSSRLPELGPKLFLYVTGITSASRPVDFSVTQQLATVSANGGTLVCQTDEMRDELRKSVSLNPSTTVISLHPMVPEIGLSFEELFRPREEYTRFIYTGKFAEHWNPTKILAGFNEVHCEIDDISLAVAGDQFKPSESNVTLVEEVRDLLARSKNVSWFGGVDRTTARRLILAADVGISWRHSALDDSLELSTKLLEYGSLARPCIMNRTPMHERIFGSDYPLFANSMLEFIEVVRTVRTEPSVVEAAARRAFQVASTYTYQESLNRVLPHLLAVVDRHTSNGPISATTIELVLDRRGPGYIRTESSIVVDASRLPVGSVVRLAEESNLMGVGQTLGPVLELVANVGVDAVDGSLDRVSRNREVLDFYVASQARTLVQRQRDRPEVLSNLTSTNGHDDDLHALRGKIQALEHQKASVEVRYRGMMGREEKQRRRAESLEKEKAALEKKYRGMTVREERQRHHVAKLQADVHAESQKSTLLSKTIEDVTTELEKASQELARQAEYSASLAAKYGNLRSSKLGRIQTWIWKRK